MIFFFFFFVSVNTFIMTTLVSILFVRLLVGEFLFEINSLNPDVAWIFFCCSLSPSHCLEPCSSCGWRERERSLPLLHRPAGTQLHPVPRSHSTLGLTGLIPCARSPAALPGCQAPPVSAGSSAPCRASGSSTSIQVWPFSRHRFSRAASDPVVFFHTRFLFVSGLSEDRHAWQGPGRSNGEPGRSGGGSVIPKKGWDQPHAVPAGNGCCRAGRAGRLLHLLPWVGIWVFNSISVLHISAEHSKSWHGQSKA